MQDVAAAFSYRLPPPDFIINQRYAVLRKSEGRQAPGQACSWPAKSFRRVTNACQARETAAVDPCSPAVLLSDSDAPTDVRIAQQQQQFSDEMQSRAREELMQLLQMLPADMQDKLCSHSDFLQV